MKSVWVDRERMRIAGQLFPDMCVVCGKPCQDRVRIRATTTNPMVGGIGYLLHATQSFNVPAHRDKGCAKKVRNSLFFLEMIPVMFIAFGSLTSLALAVAVNQVWIFLIFVVVALTAGLDFFLERKVNWWVRVNESPADGLRGAYEFEFMQDSYADAFEERNRSILTNSPVKG